MNLDDLDKETVVGDTIFAVSEQNICRVCLESTDEFINITGDEGLNVDEILSRHFTFRMEVRINKNSIQSFPFFFCTIVLFMLTGKTIVNLSKMLDPNRMFRQILP